MTAAARPEQEPIYADPYTRITWLHEEIERLREELMRCGSLAVSDRMDGCIPKSRADQIRRIVYRTCWPDEEAESNG